MLIYQQLDCQQHTSVHFESTNFSQKHAFENVCKYQSIYSSDNNFLNYECYPSKKKCINKQDFDQGS